MNYKVSLTYSDDKVANIILTEQKLDYFLDCMDSYKTYFDKETGIGFWTSKDHLRHIVIQPFVEEKQEKKEPSVAEDSKNVLSGKEDLTNREIIASQA
jgi:hypothetical protein